MGALFIVLVISAVPAIAVFIWFHRARYPFSLPKFFIFLFVGATSLFPALLFQSFFTASSVVARIVNEWNPIANIFVRIALTEELSRLIMLAITFFVIRRLCPANSPDAVPETNISPVTMASTAGLVAGFGFAILESAVIGAANPENAMLRVFTAAPLHGACGFRVGSSIAICRKYPIQGFTSFLFAVATHGIYNFMLIIPGRLSSVMAVLIALSALTSSIVAIRNGMIENRSNDN